MVPGPRDRLCHQERTGGFILSLSEQRWALAEALLQIARVWLEGAGVWTGSQWGGGGCCASVVADGEQRLHEDRCGPVVFGAQEGWRDVLGSP